MARGPCGLPGPRVRALRRAGACSSYLVDEVDRYVSSSCDLRTVERNYYNALWCSTRTPIPRISDRRTITLARGFSLHTISITVSIILSESHPLHASAFTNLLSKTFIFSTNASKIQGARTKLRTPKVQGAQSEDRACTATGHLCTVRLWEQYDTNLNRIISTDNTCTHLFQASV